MRLGYVVGEVVATVKICPICNHKLLLVQLVDEKDRPKGQPLIAVDCVDAGPGEKVLVVDEGNAASQILGGHREPVRTLIVGVVDHVDTEV
ncbi:MAG TPA: EutN/CcmL family microcompartment protein [Candidatus Saccharimonadales bacterium]|nr:EutN/CcmL family microcompartment protein [Candidatus Saccharimonadales bacterium]